MEFYGVEVASRLLLGTAQYPSPAILAEAVRAAKTDIVTVSLRRESGASRAGVRTAIVAQVTDIGSAVRSEPNSAIPNDIASWGDAGPGGTNDCDPNAPSHLCGDPSGCPPSVFSGSRVACFAVRTCALNNGSCTYGTWGSRPASDPNAAIQVRAVYKMTPVTPAIAALTGSTGGFFYLIADTTGQELY